MVKRESVIRQQSQRRPVSSMAAPVSSGDTVVEPGFDLDAAGPSSQATVVDEGYQTGHIGKEHIPRSSGTIPPTRRSTHPPTNRPNPPSGADSPTSSDGLEILGRGVKKLVQGIQELRQLGVEDLVLPLPKICVVGDQSTGKSSLIEAISEIKVPRSVGTCTRCPLEINLTESADANARWVCKVWLHKKYMQIVDRPLAGSRSRPLGPWAPQEAEDFLFATLHSKGEVEEALYWAQLATLNPGQNYERYIPGANTNTSHTFTSKFSPNVVRLDISGPGLPNLSFYDLPGVINVAEIEEERYLVKLVKNLVKDYIKADNCINLLALAMTDDAANSSAMGIIKEMGAQNRTIGVLTKPDRVQPGESFDQWKLMLSGEKYKVEHGYFVVKNPGQSSLDQGIDHVQARAEEVEFFEGNEPWRSELSQFSEQFGTTRLQTALSQKLTHQITTSLPHICEQIRRKAESIEIELAALPEPPGDNLPMILMGKLTTFNREVTQYLTGGYPYNNFQKAWNSVAVQFRKAIADSRPVLIIADPPETPRRPFQRGGRDGSPRETPGTPTPGRMHNHAIELLDSDEEQCKPEPMPSSGRKRGHAEVHGTPVSTPRKQPRLIDLPPFGTTKGQARRFTLLDIRDIIQDAHVAGIPNQVDPKAIERMSQMSVEHWDKPMKEFLQTTGDMLQNLMLAQVDDIFGAWKQTALYAEVISIVNGFLNRALIAQREAAARVYRLENLKPITYNGTALDQAREKALDVIRARRREARIARYLDEQEGKTGRVTSGQDRLKKVATITDTQLGVDPYQQEVGVMGTVRGYYDCAYSRFVDTVCRDIQAELFTDCRLGIYNELEEQLGVMQRDANERCARLMAEDPQREIRRAQLKKEKETLGKAQGRLSSLSEESPDMEVEDDLYTA